MKNKNKEVEMNSKVTLDNIAGYQYQKEEAYKIVNFFKKYNTFISAGAKLPRGAVFYGNPGTGKTLFANAIANEAGVNCYHLVDNSKSSNKTTVETIKETFEIAKQNAPSIIIIDELDRIVNCERFVQQISDEQRNNLRQLLVSIDEVADNGVMVLATINADINDVPDALVRNGRIEKHIQVDTPDKEDRTAIVKYYIGNKEIFNNIDKADIVSYTSGFSCASLASLINEVIITCLNENRVATFADFIDPIERIKNKGIKAKVPTDNSSTIYHEIGHFILNYAATKAIGMISVIPYAKTGGRFSFLNDKNDNDVMNNMNATYYYNKAFVGIGGLAATDVILNERYSGSSNDLESIMKIFILMGNNGLLAGPKGMPDFRITAISMLSGSSPSYAKVQYPDSNCVVINEFTEFLNQLYERAKIVISYYRPLVDMIYNEMNIKSVLTQQELEVIIKDYVSKYGDVSIDDILKLEAEKELIAKGRSLEEIV